MYTDFWDGTINLVSGTKVKSLIRLWRWRPYGLCSMSSGDLLVIMRSDDNKQTKVVRYSGSKEKQSIQWDDQSNPLYTSGGLYKYLSENRNLDICVADRDAGAVVVVSAAGKLRFRYTPASSKFPEKFHPHDITTDSKANILTTYPYIHCIHIIDQDGLFLHSLYSYDVDFPVGLCVDSKDKLFVTEFITCKVKKIRYYNCYK